MGIPTLIHWVENYSIYSLLLYIISCLFGIHDPLWPEYIAIQIRLTCAIHEVRSILKDVQQNESG